MIASRSNFHRVMRLVILLSIAQITATIAAAVYLNSPEKSQVIAGVLLLSIISIGIKDGWVLPTLLAVELVLLIGPTFALLGYGAAVLALWLFAGGVIMFVWALISYPAN